MTRFDLMLSLASVVAVVATLYGMASVWIVTRRGRRRVSDSMPPVTILKPLKGRDEGLESNLRSFFELDYPTYQLVFGVAEATDPAIETVRQLMREYPGRDAELVIGAPAFGLNPKVENLAAMDRYRRHDLLLISDSNVRVRPSYLRETVAYLDEPGVGLVTNLFVGTEERRTGAVLENLQLNGFVAGGVAGAWLLGATCVVGKSMLMPARVLAAAGGWLGVRNMLAEDQVLAVRVRKAGYRIGLSQHVIENVNRDRDLRWFLNRHSRWFKIRRRMAPVVYLIEPLTSPGMVGVAWLLTGQTQGAWVAGAGLIGLSLLRDGAQTWRLRGSWPGWRQLALSPVKDLFLLPVWLDALVNPRVNWRGNRLVIGRLTRLHRTLGRGSLRNRARSRRRQRGQRPPAQEG
jgi:ceramide glucosyltransferase